MEKENNKKESVIHQFEIIFEDIDDPQKVIKQLKNYEKLFDREKIINDLTNDI